MIDPYKKNFFAYFKAILIIMASILISFFIKKYVIDLKGMDKISVIGCAIPTIGTLGYLVQWKVQTLGGESPPEKLNALLLSLSYVIGIILIVLSY